VSAVSPGRIAPRVALARCSSVRHRWASRSLWKQPIASDRLCATAHPSAPTLPLTWQCLRRQASPASVGAWQAGRIPRYEELCVGRTTG
jgi:hypothetical protein